MKPALATGLLALALGVAAALFDIEPLWVAAITLALLAGASAGWVALGSRGVRITRTLGARRVMEEEPVSILLEVQGGRIALPPALIIDPLLPEVAPLRAGGGGGRIRLEVRFSRRGRRVLALPRVQISDPLGLATREVGALASPSDDELLVLPRIEPIVAAPGGSDGARMARSGRPLAGAEVDLDGIRPLRDGTPASRIFWPAVARGADPQERVLTAGGERPPLVVLDPRAAADEDALDATVRAAASIARALALAGGCSILLPGDRRPVELGDTLSGWSQVHARLAVVGGATGPALASLAQRRGPLIFVSARMRTRLPPALGPAHGQARMLVLPGALTSRSAAFTVAGCTGYVLDGARTSTLRRSA